jgi:hypothetical protein
MVRYKWKDIRKLIKECGNFIWYIDMDKNVILQGRDNKELKEEFKNKKFDKDKEFYKIFLSFHTGKEYGQGGVLAINTYHIDNKGKKISSDKNGRYWIEQSKLESLGWRKDFIEKVIRLITKPNYKFTLGIHNL